MYTHNEVKEILFKGNPMLDIEYMELIEACKRINNVTSNTRNDMKLFEEQAKKLGEEIMKTTKEIMGENKKFTFIEAMVEMEGYIEDCNNSSTFINREYTNGDEIISVDWQGRVYISELNDMNLSNRDWYLIK